MSTSILLTLVLCTNLISTGAWSRLASNSPQASAAADSVMGGRQAATARLC